MPLVALLSWSASVLAADATVGERLDDYAALSIELGPRLEVAKRHVRTNRRRACRPRWSRETRG